MRTKEESKKVWAGHAGRLLVGKKIVGARYMTDEEVDQLGWYSAAIVLQLDDGTLIFPSRDDEGNDAGAIFTTNEDLDTIPVIR